MRYSVTESWVVLVCIVAGIIKLGTEFGQWVWWLCGILVITYSLYICFRTRRIRLAPCNHGTPGAFRNRELCEQCRVEDDTKRKAEEEKHRVERESAYRQYLRKIRLPSYLQEMDPLAFEMLACDLHTRMGYDVKTTPYSGDSGADGILRKDGDLTILQAKRVQGSVGEPILRDLFGTMHSFNAKYGVVVTTGKVSRQAREWATNKPIRIIELEELSMLIRQYFPEDELVPARFIVPEDRSDLCPQCHRRLRKRNGRHGKFLGCSGYPSCNYTRRLRGR